MATARLELLADSRQVRTATSDLEQLNRTGTQSDAVIGTLRRAFVALGGALSVRELARYSDTYTGIQNRLRIVTDSTEELIFVQQQLLQVANDSRAEFETTVGLYSTLSRSTEELGLSQDRLLRVTETINKAFAASGADALTAAGAIRQLGQGLASGALRGDEFNSVAEGAPEIMRAIAQQTGMTIGELREFAAQGKITSELLIASLENYGDTVDEIFGNSQRTIAQSLQEARNNAIQFIGGIEAVNDASQTFGSVVVGLSENLDTLTDVAVGIAAIFGARMAGALAASTAATYAQVTAGLAAKVQYDALGVAISRTTVAMNSNAVAARAGAGALALIGGPVGAAVLAAGGLAYFVTQAISSQREAERLANSALSLNRQLQETNNIYQLYAEQQSEIARSSLSGLGQSELQAQFDKSSKLVELYTKRINQLRESGASLARQNQVAENLEQQKRIIAEINALMPNATTSQQQFSEKLQEVTRSLEDQIFELENGKTAYELLNATRRAGVAIDSEEAAGIQALINRREQLVAGIRAQEEAERAARQAAQEERQARENATSAFGGVQQGIASDIGGEAEQARQQLQARLDVIREYAAIEGADREAAMQAQLDAEQAFQQRLTEIRAQEEATRIQGLQNQLGAASQFFGDLNQLATAFGAEQKGINKALFVAQKAFSIAQSIIAIQTGIAQAAALPFPANLGAMATVAGATAGIVSTIQGVQAPRAQGGQVLGGNQYLVGERGPELVTMRGNGNVTPFNQLMRESGGSNVQVSVNVQNYSGAEVKTQTRSETLSNGQRREILDIIVGDITQRGRVHSAITSTTTAGGRVD